MTRYRRESVGYDPERDPQGTQIDAIKQYANTTIEEKDACRMKCSMLPEMSRLCRAISAQENYISQSKIYAALVVAGANIRYHDEMHDNRDVVCDISEYISRCMASYDRDLTNFTERSQSLFPDAKQRAIRFPSVISGRIEKESGMACIRLSDLNLYNALAGAERFNGNSPHYFPPKGRWIVDDCLVVFQSTKKGLETRADSLWGVLERHGRKKR